MSDYTNRNKKSNPDYSVIQEMTQGSRSTSITGSYSENSESQNLNNSKDYSTRKTAFTKIKYVQK
jgi:hypothetical protein